jgi:predicted nucleic acid-binding protein
MSDDFIDSNVFVYLFDETDERKRQVAQSLVNTALVEGSAQISFQVVQETLNVITRKLKVPVRLEDAHQFLDQILVPLWKINPNRVLYQRGLEIQTRYQLGFYDSLIIAASLQAGCKTLFSEDLQHGQQIETLIIQDPFRSVA